MQSYDAYEPCGSCHRHVKRRDTACPFCGATRASAQPSGPRRIRNVSRAHWLAFGTTLVGMGCNGVIGSDGAGGASHDGSPEGSASATAPDSSASAGNDASLAVDAADESAGQDDVTVADAAQDASDGSWGSPDQSCPRKGTFSCGSTPCDRATQFCNGASGSGSCRPLSDLTTVAYVMDSGTCGSCPTCDCIPPSSANTSCTCFEDNYGGLTVACSHGGCYGSPPARLDRAPLRAIG